MRKVVTIALYVLALLLAVLVLTKVQC